jgi:predicted enzyme related to lactoylglutathione lyase
MQASSLLGLRTAIYKVSDLAQAKAWYARVLGVEPYFDEPFYVGFNVGGFELRLDPAEGSAKGPGGVVAYWGVESAAASYKRLLELGATPVEPVRDVGGGIVVATVADPFGNLFGIIENPHFPNQA